MLLGNYDPYYDYEPNDPAMSVHGGAVLSVNPETGEPKLVWDDTPTPKEPTDLQKKRADQGKPAIIAEERLAFIKQQLKMNPKFGMRTKLTDGSLWKIYLADKYFIIKNTENREDAAYIRENFEELHSLVVEQRWMDEMSLADYNFIACMWVLILSEKSPWKSQRFRCFDQSLRAFMECYLEALKGVPITFGISNFQNAFLKTTGLLMPHISKTGTVPILVINEGWGLIDGENVSYVDFLGVGTNLSLYFDWYQNEDSLNIWYHDLVLSQIAKRTVLVESLLEEKEVLELTRRAALLRQIALEEIGNDKQRRARLELTFFIVFHDGIYAVTNLARAILTLEIRIGLCLSKERCEDWHGDCQLERYIAAARSFGLMKKGDMPRATCAKEAQEQSFRDECVSDRREFLSLFKQCLAEFKKYIHHYNGEQH